MEMTRRIMTTPAGTTNNNILFDFASFSLPNGMVTPGGGWGTIVGSSNIRFRRVHPKVPQNKKTQEHKSPKNDNKISNARNVSILVVVDDCEEHSKKHPGLRTWSKLCMHPGGCDSFIKQFCNLRFFDVGNLLHVFDAGLDFFCITAMLDFAVSGNLSVSP
eukprot:4321496-Amphidinium_carterae.1